MSFIADFTARLPTALRRQFENLKRPIDIQRYLDSLPYVGEERDRCPLDVMKDRQCHCLDGGLFAAVALRQIGEPGLLIDLVPKRDAAGRFVDDDHVLAVYRRHGCWGAVAKSNFPWLRYRDPVYRSLRELVMSYFDVYFSVQRLKVLHGYTRPLNIAQYDALGYAWDEAGAKRLYHKLYARKQVPLISAKSAAELQPADKLAYDSAFLGVNWDWVFRPGQQHSS
jgi:hypothetical protein